MRKSILLMGAGFFACALMAIVYIWGLVRSPVLLIPNAQTFACVREQSMLLSRAGRWRIERLDGIAIVVKSYGVNRVMQPNGFKIIFDRKIFNIPSKYQVGSFVELSEVSFDPANLSCRAGEGDVPNMTF